MDTYTHIHTYIYMYSHTPTLPPKKKEKKRKKNKHVDIHSLSQVFRWDEAHPQNLGFNLLVPPKADMSNLLTSQYLHVLCVDPLCLRYYLQRSSISFIFINIPTRTLLRNSREMSFMMTAQEPRLRCPHINPCSHNDH